MSVSDLTDMKVKEVRVGDLKPNPDNPNLHHKSQIAKIKRSLEEFGYRSPIMVTRDNLIIVGHGRLEAIKELPEVVEDTPIKVLELPFEGVKAKAYMVTDNRLGEEGEWDREKLFNIFEDFEVQGLDVLSTGFTNLELGSLGYEVNLINSVDNFDNLKGPTPGDAPGPVTPARPSPVSSSPGAGSPISKGSEVGENPGEEMVVMSFTVPGPERDKITRILNNSKKELGAKTISEAFIKIMKNYEGGQK